MATHVCLIWNESTGLFSQALIAAVGGITVKHVRPLLVESSGPFSHALIAATGGIMRVHSRIVTRHLHTQVSISTSIDRVGGIGIRRRCRHQALTVNPP